MRLECLSVFTHNVSNIAQKLQQPHTVKDIKLITHLSYDFHFVQQVAPNYSTPPNKSSSYVFAHDQTLVSSKGGVLAKCRFVWTCYLQCNL